MVESLTAEELRALPGVVGLVTAGRALGMGRTKSHELARNGKFPVKVLRIGNRYSVVTAELLAMLGVQPEQPAAMATDLGDGEAA